MVEMMGAMRVLWRHPREPPSRALLRRFPSSSQRKVHVYISIAGMLQGSSLTSTAAVRARMNCLEDECVHRRLAPTSVGSQLMRAMSCLEDWGHSVDHGWHVAGWVVESGGDDCLCVCAGGPTCERAHGIRRGPSQARCCICITTRTPDVTVQRTVGQLCNLKKHAIHDIYAKQNTRGW